MGIFDFIPDVLSAGADIFGSVLGAKSESRQREDTTFWNQESLALSKQQFTDLQESSIQSRVRDARAAGVHPLFALGASPSGASSAQFIPGQFESGNAMGEGISRAGKKIADVVRRNSPESKVNKQIARTQALHTNELTAAQASKTQAETMLIDSRRKTLESEFNSRGRKSLLGSDDGVIPPSRWIDKPKRGRLKTSGGHPWYTGKSSRGEEWEGHYQEAGNIMSFVRFLNDLGTNIGVRIPNRSGPAKTYPLIGGS